MDKGGLTAADLGKCIKPFVLIAERNAKFHSNPQRAAQFTARNVTRSIDQQDTNHLGIMH
jgi:hypothetical protein